MDLHGKVATKSALGNWIPSDALTRDFPASRRRVALSHMGIKDLLFWRDLKPTMHHRPIWPKPKQPASTMHTDSSLRAYRANLAKGNFQAGSRGQYETQGTGKDPAEN